MLYPTISVAHSISYFGYSSCFCTEPLAECELENQSAESIRLLYIGIVGYTGFHGAAKLFLLCEITKFYYKKNNQQAPHVCEKHMRSLLLQMVLW